MNKPKLIKRAEILKAANLQTTQAVTTLSQSVSVVKVWINVRQQNTKYSAREAFASLFAQSPDNCIKC